MMHTTSSYIHQIGMVEIYHAFSPSWLISNV